MTVFPDNRVRRDLRGRSVSNTVGDHGCIKTVHNYTRLACSGPTVIASRWFGVIRFVYVSASTAFTQGHRLNVNTLEPKSPFGFRSLNVLTFQWACVTLYTTRCVFFFYFNEG